MFVSLLALALFVGNSWAADEWLKGRPLSTDSWINFPADNQANNNSLDRLLANYRRGMDLTYSSATTISMSAGEVVCSNAAGTVRKMRQNTSATNVTFSDLDTGSEASSTTYYIYANCDADATTATFKISASSTTPTGVTYYKRLGSFYNDSSSNISINPITNDNVSSLASYDSGWFSVVAATNYTKTHNLGTNKLLYKLYFSPDGGTTVYECFTHNSSDGPSYATSVAVNLTTFSICTAANGPSARWSSGAIVAYTSGYLRIVAISL